MKKFLIIGLIMSILITINSYAIETPYIDASTGDWIIPEIISKEEAIDITEAPPINRVSEALDEVDANGRKMEYIGDFYLTYYCKCGKCNGYDKYGNPRSYDRYGNSLVWGTVAVDPKKIPLQTHLVIDGYDMEFVARDTGGEWVQGKHIDIYVPVSHSEALQMCKGEKRKVWKYYN